MKTTMSNTLLDSAQANLASVEKRYSEALDTVESRLQELPDSATSADIEQVERAANLDALKTDLDSAQKRVKSVTAISDARTASRHLIPAGDLRVTEPSTYRQYDPESPSYFSDLYASQKSGNPDAIARLARNNQEVAESRGAEGRAVLTTSDWYAPQFLSQLWVTTHRSRMVYAALVNQMQLPAGGETVTVPKYIAPTDSVEPQGGDNQTVYSAAGTTSQLTAPVCSYVGTVDIARQAVERSAYPGFDEVIYTDLARDISRKIELACLQGTGSNTQPLGIFNDSGVPVVSVSAQTAAKFLLAVGDHYQRIETAVGSPPDFLLIHPRRWAWMASLVDSQNRPIVNTNQAGPFQSYATFAPQPPEDGGSVEPDIRPVGTMMGLNIFTSSAISTAGGTGTNSDYVLMGDSSLAVRFYDGYGVRNFSFEGVASASGSVRLMSWAYGSYLTRYPLGFGIIENLTPPNFS
jgi:HK97 family phage major capsid protein